MHFIWLGKSDWLGVCLHNSDIAFRVDSSPLGPPYQFNIQLTFYPILPRPDEVTLDLLPSCLLISIYESTEYMNQSSRIFCSVSILQRMMEMAHRRLSLGGNRKMPQTKSLGKGPGEI